MAFIKLGSNIKNVGESQNIPEGRYRLRIAEKEFNDTKKNYKLTIIVENPPTDISEPFPISHWISLPVGDDLDKDKNKWRFTRRFLYLFGIPYNEDGFDDDDLVGAVADDARVFSEPYENKETGKKGTMMRIDTDFNVPKEHLESFEGRKRTRRR